MFSLDADFQAVLIKSSQLNLRYCIKVNVQESQNNASDRWGYGAYGTGNWYFSGEYWTVTDGTAFPVRGILKNADIPIIQTIDIRQQKGSIGGFSIQLIDDGLFGDLANYSIYNRDIWIYLIDSSLTNKADFLLLYKGIVKDYSIANHVVTINIENSTGTVQRDLPKDFYTPDDDTYSQQPDDIRNKRVPIVYGDRPFYYGNDVGHTDLTNIANVHKQENNMTKAFYVGMNSAGKHVYLIAKIALKMKDTNYYRAWMFDTNLNRYVQIDDGAVTFSTDGNSYQIVTIDNLPSVYDFWFSDGTYSNLVEVGDASWSNPANGCNKDYTNAADSSLVVPTQASSASLDIDFPVYDGYQEDADISEVKIYGKIGYTETDAVFIFTIDGNDATGFDDTQLNELGAEAATRAGIENSVPVIHSCAGATAEESVVLIYSIYKTVKYTVKEMFPIFVACQGRPCHIALASYFDDINWLDLLEHPVHIIGSILYDELGLRDTDFNTADFNTVYDDLTGNYKLAFTIYDKINSKNLIDEICKESKLVAFWNTNNKLTINKIDDIGATDRTIYKNEIEGLPRTYKTRLSDIVNFYDLKYKKELRTGEYQEKLNREDDRANTGSQDIYSAEMYDSMESDYISDDTTAGLFADLWCKDDADSFWSVIHNIVEFETADIRGIKFYDGGTFVPLYLLELLDVIEFDSTSMDPMIKCNGESWSGKQFKIFEIVRNKTTLKVKAIEV